MKTRTLGTSSLVVTEICCGTMTFGSYCDEASAHAQMDKYIELGGNFFDLAELYPVPPKAETGGLTEIIFGNWLRKNPSIREKIIVATKVAGPGRGWIAQKRFEALGQTPAEAEAENFTPKQIRHALEASLKRMNTSYVDLYQLHWPDRPVPLWGANNYTEKMSQEWMGGKGFQFYSKHLDETVLCLGELIKEGKIKAFGLSNETAYGLAMFCEACKRLNVPLPCTVQQDFSLLDRTFEQSLLEVCVGFNVSLISYGTLAGGSLSGKYLEASKRPKQELANCRHVKTPGFQPRYHAPRSMAAIAKYADLAAQEKLSLTQLAYAWALSRFYMGSVIIGTTSVEQMIENCSTISLKLSQEVIDKVDQVHDELPNPNCTYYRKN